MRCGCGSLSYLYRLFCFLLVSWLNELRDKIREKPQNEGDNGFESFGGILNGIYKKACLAPQTELRQQGTTRRKEHHPHPSHHPLSILSGGGDYRGIYDISLKRGFYGVYRPFIECPLQDR
jgi:hypothetical protein